MIILDSNMFQISTIAIYCWRYSSSVFNVKLYSARDMTLPTSELFSFRPIGKFNNFRNPCEEFIFWLREDKAIPIHIAHFSIYLHALHACVQHKWFHKSGEWSLSHKYRHGRMNKSNMNWSGALKLYCSVQSFVGLIEEKIYLRCRMLYSFRFVEQRKEKKENICSQKQ